MTLRNLLDQFDDETWFCASTPDGAEHLFWNADYIGAHPDVMPELEPLLDREISDDTTVELRDNPENPMQIPSEVPVVCVWLLMTDEERERYGKTE